MVVPASAFTAGNLQILVDGDGDADVTFNYTLSWIERIAVFFKIAEPEQELKSALEEASGAPVTVTSTEVDAAAFSILGFAKLKNIDNETIYSTPALDFTGAQAMLDRYWFAPLVRADFSPEKTVVQFSDGYEEEFSNQSSIPALVHIIP